MNLATQEKTEMVITDRNLPEPFRLKMSANAWWNDVGKVRDLMRGFRMALNVKESCILAGISKDQYYYFLDIHPEFSDIKERLQVLPGMKAWQTIINDLDNIKTAKWFLAKHGRRDRHEEEEEERPSELVFCANCGIHIINSGYKAKVFDSGAEMLLKSTISLKSE